MKVLILEPVAPVPAPIDVPFLVNRTYGYASMPNPKTTDTFIKIKLLENFGVMLAEKPVTFEGVAEVVENLSV
jgi:hypothetical protein